MINDILTITEESLFKELEESNIDLNRINELARKQKSEGLTEEEKQEDMSKLDKWLSEHLSEKMTAVITSIASVIGVVFAMLIFLLSNLSAASRAIS